LRLAPPAAITHSNHEPASACHQPSHTPQLDSKFKIPAGKITYRPLRGEPEHLQDPAHVLQKIINAEFPPDQVADHLLGPQGEIELKLVGIPCGFIRPAAAAAYRYNSFLRPEAIFVDNAARPPARHIFCRPYTDDSVTSKISATIARYSRLSRRIASTRSSLVDRRPLRHA